MSLTTPARTKMGSKLMALTLAAGLLAGPIAVDAAPAEAATKKCAVKMSNSKPRQYSNTWVNVSKVGPKAKVETIAHYKTTKTKKKATASKKGKTVWKCSSSFKPVKKR